MHVARKHGARVLAGVRAKEKEEASKLKVDGVVGIDSEEEMERLRDLDAIKTIRKGGVLGSVLGTSTSRRLWRSRKSRGWIN